MPSRNTTRTLSEAWRAGKALLVPPPPNPDRAGPLAGWDHGWAPNQREEPVRAVGDGQGTSILENLLRTKAEMLSEVPLAVYRRPDSPRDEPEPLDDPTHPIAMLLEQPNPTMSWSDLVDYEVGATDISGTAFYLKGRDRPGGPVVALWPLYPTWVRPKGHPVHTWRYEPPGSEPVDLDPADVVVRRHGLNRADHRLGRSAVAPILREIATDEEAARYSSAVLHNLGVPGVVISPRTSGGMAPIPPSQTERDEVARTWQDRFGGARRGRPFVTAGAWQVDVVSFSPKDLTLVDLRRIPEERLSGAIGIPAILAGLGVGLDHATYANVGGLREFVTEQKLVPWWKAAARQWTRQLLDPIDRVGLVLSYPLDQVRALAADVAADAARLTGLYAAGIVGLEEARTELGYDPTPPADLTVPVSVPAEVVRAGTRDAGWDVLAKGDDGFDLDAWTVEYEGDIAAVLTGWATRFADAAGLVDDPAALEDAADAAVGDGADLAALLEGLGVRLVRDAAYGPDAIPTGKAPTLNPRDVTEGMRRFIRAHTARSVEGIVEWTRQRVRAVIRRGVDAGAPTEEIAAGVARWLGDAARARRVAETEAHAVRWAAADYAARVDPRPMWKEWRSVGDDRVRDSHAAAHGQRVLDYEFFHVGGTVLQYPGDPAGPASETVSCRCAMTFRLASNVPGGYYGR